MSSTPGARPQHTPGYRHLFGRLRQWRVAAGLTRRTLAAERGKPPSYVHKCEVGDRRIDLVERAY